MVLSFSTKLWGKPTRFMEKIVIGLYSLLNFRKEEFAKTVNHPEFIKEDLDALLPKIHTIREDKRDRWKPGNLIHMVINNRQKSRFQFAPVLKVVATQRINIQYTRNQTTTTALVLVDGVSLGLVVWKNGCLVDYNLSILALAKNDGFETINQFFEWFKEDFEGKIIHWTNVKY